jgi:hypothetical protein
LSTEKCARDGRKPEKNDQTKIAVELPILYAEIELRLATDESAVKPELVNLYYKTAFDPKRSSDERDLAFTVQLSSPDGKSITNVLVAKSGLLPADKQQSSDEYELSDAVGLWTVLPKYSGVALSVDGVGLRVGAVNITAEVRETGKVNAFLQAFAAAYEADKKKYADAIAAGVLPTAQQSAAAGKMKGEAAVLEAQAALDKAKSDYQSACAKQVGGAKGYANDEQMQLEVSRSKNLINAAWQKLRAAQLENGVAVDSTAPSVTPCN